MPSDNLKPYVKCYIVVDCNMTMVNRMFPHTSVIMGFRFRGTTKYITQTENTLPFAVIAGLRKSIQLMKDEAGTSNLLVIFHTAKVASFFKEPIHLLFDEVIALNEMNYFNDVNEIEDKLCSAATDQQRIQVLEDFLIKRIKPTEDHLIYEGTKIISSSQGIVRIKDITNKLNISIDAFEKRFRKMVGCSPKQFSYIIRMNSAINSLENQSIAQTALNAGYYDQSHFVKDFKIFTGQTPSEFLKSQITEN